MKELARFKPMQRHLFLYERALLFCKKREEHGDGCDKTPSYSFKHCLKVGLCLCASYRTTPVVLEHWLKYEDFKELLASSGVSVISFPVINNHWLKFIT